MKRHRPIGAVKGRALPSYDSSRSFCSRTLLLASSPSTISTCRGSKGPLETEHLDSRASIAGFGCENIMQTIPAAHWGIPAGPRSSAPASVLLTCGLLLPCCRPLQNVMTVPAAGLLSSAARTHNRSPFALPEALPQRCLIPKCQGRPIPLRDISATGWPHAVVRLTSQQRRLLAPAKWAPLATLVGPRALRPRSTRGEASAPVHGLSRVLQPRKGCTEGVQPC